MHRWGIGRLLWLCAVVALSIVASLAGAASGRGPLPDQQRQALAAIDEDPAPNQLVDGFHFVISNEKHLERYRKAVTDLGGLFVGVGAEQNYLLAGWAKPEVLILMDFDQVIADLHAVHGAFFLASKTPDDFVDLWAEKNEERARAQIDRSLEGKRRERARWVYTTARQMVHDGLVRTKLQFERRNVPIFLTDRSQYDFIVELVRDGRVRSLRGDLVGDRAMKDIATFARSAELPVRALYMSNAEEYFRYTESFRANIAALPVDDRSLVLRTVHDGADDFLYMVQGAEAFQNWLSKTKVRNLRQMLNRLGGRWLYSQLGGLYRLPGP